MKQKTYERENFKKKMGATEKDKALYKDMGLKIEEAKDKLETKMKVME